MDSVFDGVVQELDLSVNPIADKGAEKMAEALPHMANLKETRLAPHHCAWFRIDFCMGQAREGFMTLKLPARLNCDKTTGSVPCGRLGEREAPDVSRLIRSWGRLSLQ